MSAVDAVLGPLLEPGSNGLAVDPHTGDLIVCDHGNRRVAVVKAATTTSGFMGGSGPGVVVETIVDGVAAPSGGGCACPSNACSLNLQALGAAFCVCGWVTSAVRFNAPNDAAVFNHEHFFLTDPSWGLRRMWGPTVPEDTPGRQQDNGVCGATLACGVSCFMLFNQATFCKHTEPLTAVNSACWLRCVCRYLVSRGASGNGIATRVAAADRVSKPNGIALSPSGNQLYVSDSDHTRAEWWVRCCCCCCCYFVRCIGLNLFDCLFYCFTAHAKSA